MMLLNKVRLSCLFGCMSILPNLVSAQATTNSEPGGRVVISVNGETVRQSEMFDRLMRIRAQDFVVSAFRSVGSWPRFSRTWSTIP